VGQPVKLCDFQKAIVRGIYDTPTRRAIVSFGKKNAKTTLAAFLLLLHTCGPEARVNSQLYSGAQSLDQAALVFALAAKVVRMSPELSAHVIIRDTVKELYCPGLGTIYKALELLGLKLSKTTGPAEYLLIESVQRPRPNLP